jgi:hypothetical protein
VNRSAECDELSTQAQQRARIQTWLSSCDWLVLSDRFADQYLPLSVEFEAISAFYSDLLNCRDGGWEQVAEFWSWPQLFGVSVDDRGSELTFRSFDHPTIWVFRRRIP